MDNKIIVRIKHSFLEKDRQKTGEKFIEIMEVIYAIILACGVVKIVGIFEKTSDTIKISTWFSIWIAILVLIRFFFAPSKNIKILIKNAKWRVLIMPFDVLILIVHSFIYFYMCINIRDATIFYRGFFILLAVNSFWLFAIWARLKKEEFNYIKTWAINNSVFVSIYVLTLFIGGFFYWNPWVILFILAFTNSMIDLIKTYPSYLTD